MHYPDFGYRISGFGYQGSSFGAKTEAAPTMAYVMHYPDFGYRISGMYRRGADDSVHAWRDAVRDPGALREETFVAAGRRILFGGLVFKAHTLLYHSTLGLSVIKKKKKTAECQLRIV